MRSIFIYLEVIFWILIAFLHRIVHIVQDCIKKQAIKRKKKVLDRWWPAIPELLIESILVLFSCRRGQPDPDVSPRHETAHGFVSVHRFQRCAPDRQQTHYINCTLYVPILDLVLICYVPRWLDVVFYDSSNHQKIRDDRRAESKGGR